MVAHNYDGETKLALLWEQFQRGEISYAEYKDAAQDIEKEELKNEGLHHWEIKEQEERLGQSKIDTNSFFSSLSEIVLKSYQDRFGNVFDNPNIDLPIDLEDQLVTRYSEIYRDTTVATTRDSHGRFLCFCEDLDLDPATAAGLSLEMTREFDIYVNRDDIETRIDQETGQIVTNSELQYTADLAVMAHKEHDVNIAKTYMPEDIQAYVYYKHYEENNGEVLSGEELSKAVEKYRQEIFNFDPDGKIIGVKDKFKDEKSNIDTILEKYTPEQHKIIRNQQNQIDTLDQNTRSVEIGATGEQFLDEQRREEIIKEIQEVFKEIDMKELGPERTKELIMDLFREKLEGGRDENIIASLENSDKEINAGNTMRLTSPQTPIATRNTEEKIVLG